MKLSDEEVLRLRQLHDQFSEIERKSADSFAEYLEDLLLWMKASVGLEGYEQIPVSWFEAAQPIWTREAMTDYRLPKQMIELRELVDKAIGPETPSFSDITPSHLPHQIRNVKVMRAGDFSTEIGRSEFLFWCCRELNKKEIANYKRVGLLTGVANRVYVIGDCHISHNLARKSGLHLFGWYDGLGVIDLDARGRWNAKSEITLSDLFQNEMNEALRDRYDWFVDVRTAPDRTSLRLPTDYLGAQDLMHKRDIPEGRERRQVLRHWVKEHWRQSRVNSDEEHRVRAHLRGHEKFRVGNLHCRIVPSEYDADRALAAKKQGSATRKREAS